MRPERKPLADSRAAGVLPPNGPRGVVPTGYAEARRLYLAGRISDALSHLEEIFRAALAGAQDDLRDAALLRAWCLIEKREHEICRRWLEKARRFGYVPEKDVAAAVIDLNLLIYREKYAEVREAAAALLAGLDDAPSLERAELRLLLGAALRWEGRTVEALPHLEYACSAFVVLEEPGRAAVADNFLGWTLLSLGRLDEAASRFARSLEINTRLGSRLRRAQNFQNLSIVRYKQGRYASARRYLHRELELVDGRPDMQCRARIALGNVERLQGDTLSARGNLLEAYGLARSHDLAREEVLALEFLGDVFRDERNPEQAQRYYRRGLSRARSLAPEGDLVMELLRRQGECLQLEGRHDEAHNVLNAALDLCRQVGDEHETAVTLRCLGVNSASLGCWPRAILQLEQALTELKRLSAGHEAMIAGYHLARLLVRQLDTGNSTQARDRVLGRAWEIALGARQTNRELDTPVLAGPLRELVNDLARRRLDDRPGLRRRTFPAPGSGATRVVAVSDAMRRVLKQCDGFAASDCPVLISGECGSSKELLARRIHENSARAKQSWLRISCAASDAGQLAAQLFGRAEGGEADERPLEGVVRRADGGTLLLAHVDEMPKPLQEQLVRLLNEGTYRPVGDAAERRADVRVIATTSRDLDELVQAGRFRPDLHFKLRLMRIQVPPLRTRPADAMPLLDHFLTRLEGSTLTARALFDFHSLEELATYPWPGGSSELEGIAQRAWLNRNLDQPVALRRVDGPAGPALEFTGGDGGAGPVPSAGRRLPPGMTWASLNALIRKAGGNKSRAARALGVHRVTVHRWLKMLKPES